MALASSCRRFFLGLPVDAFLPMISSFIAEMGGAQTSEGSTIVVTEEDNSDSWLLGFFHFPLYLHSNEYHPNLLTFYLMPNGDINNYFWLFE